MKRLLGGIFLALVIGVPVYAALKAGGAAPDFSTKASLAGKEFDYSLKAALAKGPVVVYFYPSAFTGGCNIEAHTFAETKDKFDAAGATVIGVSRDSIARLNAFSSDPQVPAPARSRWRPMPTVRLRRRSISRAMPASRA